jgi:hypothetical protein
MRWPARGCDRHVEHARHQARGSSPGVFDTCVSVGRERAPRCVPNAVDRPHERRKKRAAGRLPLTAPTSGAKNRRGPSFSPATTPAMNWVIFVLSPGFRLIARVPGARPSRGYDGSAAHPTDGTVPSPLTWASALAFVGRKTALVRGRESDFEPMNAFWLGLARKRDSASFSLR